MKAPLALLCCLLAASLAAREPPALPSGDQVVERVNARDEGRQLSRKVTMILTDRNGKSRVRETLGLRVYLADQKQTAIYFEAPGNLRGTAFLTYDYRAAGRDDDRWLYLPALRKVRRISATDRGDYFLGTDMTYEDIKLETRISDDYRYRTVRAGRVDDHDCLWLEAGPKSESLARELGYSRVESCIDSAIWIAREARFWDLAGNPLKTARTTDIRQVQDIWTPHRIIVENHKTGHRTEFRFSDIDYQTPIDPTLLQPNALHRGP